MRKIILAASIAALTAAVTACGNAGAKPQAEDFSRTEKTVDTEEAVDTEKTLAQDSGTEASGNAKEPESGGGREFGSINLKMKEGTLKILPGDSFSITYGNEEPAEYEITEGTLYFKNSQSKDVILTLPEDEKYDFVLLDVKDGHILEKGALAVEALEVHAERSDVQIEGINVEASSAINVDSGSVFLSGNPGTSVTADCRQGHLNLAIPSEESYNYELEASDGNIRVGKRDYHGRTIAESIDNGAERLMRLHCSKGDIAVESGTDMFLGTDSETGEIY